LNPNTGLKTLRKNLKKYMLLLYCRKQAGNDHNCKYIYINSQLKLISKKDSPMTNEEQVNIKGDQLHGKVPVAEISAE
jgi:hypothetical protein